MTLAEYAKSWIGKRFNGEATEQCMMFVRHCLQEVNSPIKDKVTIQPVDGLETSYALASSLAGRDIGAIITTLPQENDIVFFKDTYGNWPAGTITHVGIVVDNKGSFVHRPTASRPVEMANMMNGYWADHYRCSLDYTTDSVNKGRSLKWFMHDGKTNLLIDGKVDSSTFNLSNYSNQLVINGKSRNLKAAKIELVFED